MTPVGGTLVSLHRYPVKSMLGEDMTAAEIDRRGLVGDRALAVIDAVTGFVATAKQPRWWRALLRCRAWTGTGSVHVVLPDGRDLPVAHADRALTELLGRQVRLSSERVDGARVERPDPEQVLAHGVDAAIDPVVLEIAQGTPHGRFVDHSPLHLITTATLDVLGVPALRYRPNLVIETPPGYPPFCENDWVGREFSLGGVRLAATLPTPRCSVPTLEHGDLPRAAEALRALLRLNRVDVEGFGVLPCAGLYARVLDTGTVRVGDTLTP